MKNIFDPGNIDNEKIREISVEEMNNFEKKWKHEEYDIDEIIHILDNFEFEKKAKTKLYSVKYDTEFHLSDPLFSYYELTEDLEMRDLHPYGVYIQQYFLKNTPKRRVDDSDIKFEIFITKYQDFWFLFSISEYKNIETLERHFLCDELEAVIEVLQHFK